MPTRREYITAAGTGLTITIAGCSGDGDEGTEPSGDGSTPTDSEGALEIMIAWTGEDGAAGFDALHEGFQSAYPDSQTEINDNPGGAGTGLATALDTRMFNENPPSTWGFFTGPELTDYVDAGLMGDVTDEVWEEEGLEDVIPEYLQDLCYFEDVGYVAVPLEFNRLNNLFYNTSIVEEAGVDPASIESPVDLLDAMERVESETDAVGMAYTTQAPWTVMQLWETILLGEHGYDTYTSFLNGNVEDNEDALKDSLGIMADYREFFNEDHGSINFTEATSDFIGGQAAFHNQGDWAVGNFSRADDFAYDEDWAAIPFPGSDDTFLGQCSGFMYPEPNPTPNGTKNWLRYAGTVDGQVRFNSHKGGVPCRNDAPMDDDEWAFNDHQRSQYEDFLAVDNLSGTIAHNNVVVPQIASNVTDVFSTFAGEWDVDATYDRLVDAFDL